MTSRNPLATHPLSQNLREHFRRWTSPKNSRRSYEQYYEMRGEESDTSVTTYDSWDVPLLSLPEDDNDNNQNNSNQTMLSSSQKQQRRMEIVAQVLAGCTFLSLVALIPWLTIRAVQDYDLMKDAAAFYSAAAFVILAIIVSTREIYLHMTNWYMPDVQKYVVRILFMVPLYAIQSWFSLRFHDARIYIDTIRDFYEAFVMAAFVYLIIELLGGEDSLADMLRTKDPSYGQHKFCMRCFFSQWHMGEHFMLQCKWGVLQYVIVKTLVTIATIILEPLGLYDEGSFSPTKGYLYLTFFLNISVSWALYCLVIFFHAIHHELSYPHDWHPLGKFICIKGVVFFTFWQGFIISILVAVGVIGQMGSWDADEVAKALQDYLICVEMLFFAIGHSFAYSYKECLPDSFKNNAPSLTQHPSHAHDFHHDPHIPDPYMTPSQVRTLNAPASLSTAFWSASIPSETLSDLKRFSHGPTVAIADQQRQPGITLSTKYAESI